jgi:hypothetical protein
MAQSLAVAAMLLCREAEATNHGFLVGWFCQKADRTVIGCLPTGSFKWDCSCSGSWLAFARLTLRAQFGRLKKLC